LTDRPADTAGVTGTAPIDAEDLHRLVLQSLDDDQAQEVVSIPLAGKSNIADHMVIASGRSTRQVASICEERPNRGASSRGLGADRCGRRDRPHFPS
jgi:ribosome-associated protein